jgi:hypothetical protein
MKNITKILFAIILSFSVVSFANAGELSVTGSAQATYVISSSDSGTGKVNKPKGIGMSNEIAFNASGDFADGFTWKYQMELDPDQRNGAAINDDSRLELGTPYGTVGIYNSEGDLNTHLKSSVAAYAPGHDIGTSGGYEGGTGINSYSNIQYHTPSGLLPNDISVKVAYSNGQGYGGDADDAAATKTEPTPINSYQIIGSPVEGATLGASYLEKTNTAISTSTPMYETYGLFGKYNVGSFSFGAGRHQVYPNVGDAAGTCATTTAVKTYSTSVSATTGLPSTTTSYCAGTRFFENDALSVAFQVNPELSVSVDKMTSTANVTNTTGAGVKTETNRDLKVQSVQAAYNIGGAVVAIGQKNS